MLRWWNFMDKNKCAIKSNKKYHLENNSGFLIDRNFDCSPSLENDHKYSKNDKPSSGDCIHIRLVIIRSFNSSQLTLAIEPINVRSDR